MLSLFITKIWLTKFHLQEIHKVIEINIACRIFDKLENCLSISFDYSINVFLVFDIIFQPCLAPLLILLSRVFMYIRIMYNT